MVVSSAPGHHTGEIAHKGLKRTYRIHIPQSFSREKPVPLVVALHGGGGTGMHMERLTLDGFNTLSDKEGFIVVYPDGIERHWNDGRTKVRYRTHREKIDDVGFLSALIDRLIEERNVDPRRVYATGMSNGAMMSFRLACEVPHKLAAVAPVGGAMPVEQKQLCKHTTPICVLVMANTMDPCVPWGGGQIRVAFRPLGTVLSVPDSVQFWAAHNGCSATPAVTTLPDSDSQDGTRVRREVYRGGRKGTEVVLYAIEGGGHTWPSGHQYLAERYIGRTCRDINACQVIWEFFKRHARERGDLK